MAFEELNLPSHWDCKTLAECTSSGNISYGIVQPGQFDPHGVGIIRVNNFQNDHLDVSDVLKVSTDIESKFSKTRLDGGEVLLTLVGSTGLSAVVPPELKGWNVARAVAVIQPGKEVSAEWINICLQSPYTKYFLDARANTTVQKTLNLKDVKEIPIPIPPKEERVRIEEILVSLNQKITLNRQINQTLEQMAQTLFKSWFVDFDPVIDNALDAGNDIPDTLQERAEQRRLLRAKADFKPLPAETRALFPSEFEETELGWVPKGWGYCRLVDISSISSGKRPPTKFDEKNEENFIPVWGGNGIKWFTNEYLFSSEYIITGRVGTLGTVYKVNGLSWPSDNALVIKPNNENCFEFIYQQLSNTDIESLNSGSTQPLVTQTALGNIDVLFPNNADILSLFQNQTGMFDKKTTENLLQIECLTSLRDSLVPKLISGELALNALPEVPELAESR